MLIADALTVSAKERLFPLPKTWILTPHEGELSRILNISAAKIRKDRTKYLRLAQKKCGCIVLLKGHETLVAAATEIYKIDTGNVALALAKAGTGDVLTGMITGFLAQGLTPLNATLLGASLHGKIADDWVLRAKKDYLSLMASDLVDLIPTTLHRLRTRIS